MSATFTAEEIIELTSGRLACGRLPDGAAEISTDTRTLKAGQWYLAFTGGKFDGHDFIGEAAVAGARGSIVQERPGYPIADAGFPLIAVNDTLGAYHTLARRWRENVAPKVIAVTGSSGKTTTKEMCAAVAEEAFRTHRSSLNENNEIGVPKTMLSMPPDTEVLVLELAMRALGEIRILAEISAPDIGVIVNVGTAHLGPLASLESIAEANCELAEVLERGGGRLILGQQSRSLLRRVRQVFSRQPLVFPDQTLKINKVTPESTRFSLQEPGPAEVEFEVEAHGTGRLADAWCAIAAGRCLGMSDEKIAQGLRSYRPLPGRGNIVRGPSGATLVDETYNANPDSVMTSVCVFTDPRVFPQRSKYLVIGEMAELGQTADQIHEELGRWLKDQALDCLITVGLEARHIAAGARGAAFEIYACLDQSEVFSLLSGKLDQETSILFKGSRCARLDELVSQLVRAKA